MPCGKSEEELWQAHQALDREYVASPERRVALGPELRKAFEAWKVHVDAPMVALRLVPTGSDFRIAWRGSASPNDGQVTDVARPLNTAAQISSAAENIWSRWHPRRDHNQDFEDACDAAKPEGVRQLIAEITRQRDETSPHS